MVDRNPEKYLEDPVEDPPEERLENYTQEDLEDFLRGMPEDLRQHYAGAGNRGYYDKEKYRRTAMADRRTSEPEDQDPPQS